MKEQLSANDPRVRFFRIKFYYRDMCGPRQAYQIGRKVWEQTNLPAPDPQKWFVILGNEPRVEFPAPGECIYCGALKFNQDTNLPLSEEHIVPEGFGARLVIPFASCEECEKSTKRFEQVIVRDVLRPVRRKLGIRGKKGRRHGSDANAFQVPVIKDGVESLIEFPLEEHPTCIVLPEFGLPARMTPIPDQHGVKNLWAMSLVPHDDMVAKGHMEFASPTLDTVSFCQLLAKMAHGLAVARFGLHGFTPLLTEHIRANYKKTVPGGEWLDRYEFIGSDQTVYAPVHALHLYQFVATTAPNATYLVVRIRLFAHLPGTPIYQILIGTFTEAHLRSIRAEGAIP